MNPTNDQTAMHLAKFLDDFEARFDNDPTELSPELMADYLVAAKHMAEKFNRDYNRRIDVFNYMNEFQLL